MPLWVSCLDISKGRPSPRKIFTVRLHRLSPVVNCLVNHNTRYLTGSQAGPTATTKHICNRDIRGMKTDLTPFCRTMRRTTKHINGHILFSYFLKKTYPCCTGVGLSTRQSPGYAFVDCDWTHIFNANFQYARIMAYFTFFVSSALGNVAI